MNRPLLANVLSSLVDKGFTIAATFAATLLMVRLLPRADYGIVGIVAGYGVLIQVINISLENAILRDHRDYAAHPERFLLNYFVFNLLKALAILALGLALAALLPVVYGSPHFGWAVGSLVILTLSDAFVAPLVIYASTQYQQRLVTGVNIVRFSLNLVLVGGLLIWPSLAYLFFKELAMLLVTIAAWAFVSRRYLRLNFATVSLRVSLRQHVDLRFIHSALTRQSIWFHLIGIANAFIYRADALFLSLFAPLTVVGNYSIALASANVANVVPAILGYQNTVAISSSTDERRAFQLTDMFLRASLYVGLATLLGFVLLGHFYLQIMTGEQNVSAIYQYMICIVVGLVVAKTLVSPLISYVNAKGDVRGMFLRVNLPALLFSACSYFLSARFGGATGVAAANVVNALFWVTLMIVEMKRYGYRPQLSFRTPAHDAVAPGR